MTPKDSPARLRPMAEQRLADPKLAEMRFDLKRHPRCGKAGANVTQMHYARLGIITPEMEFVAIRENQRCEQLIAERTGNF